MNKINIGSESMENISTFEREDRNEWTKWAILADEEEASEKFSATTKFICRQMRMIRNFEYL